MQKFFALLMTVTVLLGLAGCSGDPDTAAEPNPPTVYDGTGEMGGSGATAYGDSRAHPDAAAGTSATPYEDMVENGRVRDSDGILSDGENPQR